MQLNDKGHAFSKKQIMRVQWMIYETFKEKDWFLKKSKTYVPVK